MHRRPFLIALFYLMAAFAWRQATLPPGAAKGAFVAGGKTVQLRHAYALIKPNEMDEGKDALYLVISDAPLTEATLREQWGLAEASRDGRLSGMEVRLDESKSPACGQLYHAGLEGSVSVCGIAKLDLTYYDGKRISGRLFTGPQESFDQQWELTADFTAGILPKPAPAPEKLLPLDSPPAKLALAFVKAARAGDKAGLKKLITPDMAADLYGPDGDKIMGFLKEAYPLTMKLTKVVQKGEDKAEIVFTGKSSDGSSSASTTMKAAYINGGWILTK